MTQLPLAQALLKGIQMKTLVHVVALLGALCMFLAVIFGTVIVLGSLW